MSQDFHGPASHAPEPPTVAEEKAQRQAHRDQIAAMFKRRPLEELTSDELRMVTPNFQQRISECRRELGMRIVNVRQWLVLEDGSKKRLEGHYRYETYVPLGPSSDQYRQTKRLF
jgi:hypothetical protein